MNDKGRYHSQRLGLGAIPGLMHWNNLEPLASETRKALLVTLRLQIR